MMQKKIQPPQGNQMIAAESLQCDISAVIALADVSYPIAGRPAPDHY
jgi:hypothetical protein